MPIFSQLWNETLKLFHYYIISSIYTPAFFPSLMSDTVSPTFYSVFPSKTCPKNTFYKMYILMCGKF